MSRAARVAVLTFALAAPLAAGDLFDRSPAPEVVRAAHRALLAGDLPAALASSREGLTRYADDEAIRNNLLGLLDLVIERAGAPAGPGDALPGWQLPRGLRSLSLGTERERRRPDAQRVPGSGRGPERRRLKLILGLAPGDAVAALRVSRHPDRPLIDLAGGRGLSGTFRSPRFGAFHWSSAELDDDDRADGLYLVHVELRSGTRGDTWLPLVRGESSATPVVLSPLPGQVLASANPVLRFADFRSPEWRPGETRELTVDIERNEEIGFVQPERDDTIWSCLVDEPALESLTVGPGGGREPGSADRLAPGRYLLRLTYREHRRLGPSVLTRESTTCVAFQVRPGAR